MYTCFVRSRRLSSKRDTAKGVSIDGRDGKRIVNRRCGSRGPGRHAAFFAPKDVELVGHGARLRLADLSRLKFVFINLSADLAESSYRVTALWAGERYVSIESEPPRAVANGHTVGEDEVPEQECRSQLASPLSWQCLCKAPRV
jgi:hypothetical protein